MSEDGWDVAGSVEVLRLRVYPLDPTGGQTSVCVEPGVYPVYRKLDAYQWVMTGRMNERIEAMGDGMFALHQGDRPTGLTVQFPSRVMTRGEIEDLAGDPDLQSRLRITLAAEVS